MNHPGTANYHNWTIDFRDMNYSEAGSEDPDDFDPSRCGHVDEHYSQARKDLDIQQALIKIWEEVSARGSGVWRTFKGSKAQRATLFFKGFQISLIKIGSPPTISRLKRRS